MFNQKHSGEARRKMSEAGKRRWAQEREKKVDNGYRTLMAAIVS